MGGNYLKSQVLTNHPNMNHVPVTEPTDQNMSILLNLISTNLGLFNVCFDLMWLVSHTVTVKTYEIAV